MPVLDNSREFGSAGSLQSVCNMDALAKYPDDPFKKFLGENSTVSVMGQEIGHRWLASLMFRDHNGRQSPRCSDVIAPIGVFSSIRTHRCSKATTSSTSVADCSARRPPFNATACSIKYAMGLVDQTQVPPFFYVENPLPMSARLAMPRPIQKWV